MSRDYVFIFLGSDSICRNCISFSKGAVSSGSLIDESHFRVLEFSCNISFLLQCPHFVTVKRKKVLIFLCIFFPFYYFTDCFPNSQQINKHLLNRLSVTVLYNSNINFDVTIKGEHIFAQIFIFDTVM